MTIHYSSEFEKHFKKLPRDVQELALKKEKIFQRDPSSPTLRTHPLTGRLKGVFAFWIKYHYRIKFIFEEDGSITFIDVGTHGVYK